MDAQSDSPAIQHEYVTDASYVGRLTGMFTVFVLTRPLTLVVLGLLLLIALLLGLLVLLGLPEAGLLALFALASIPLIIVLAYALTRRRFAARLPAGSRLRIGLGDTSIRVEDPLVASDVSYRAYSRVLERRGFVLLQLRGTRMYSVLPVELFPGNDLEHLREAITGA